MELTPQQQVQAYVNSIRRFGWEVNFSMPANYEGIHILTVIKYNPITKEVETFWNYSGPTRIKTLKKALREVARKR